MHLPKKLIVVAVVLVAVCGGVMFLLRSPSDGMDAYPHAFIAEPGYDPSLVTSIAAPIDKPPPAPEGMAPAWQCDDPVFRDAEARPWLFPMRRDGEAYVIPIHPQLKRSPAIKTCHIYRTPEAERQLAAFRARISP